MASSSSSPSWAASASSSGGGAADGGEEEMEDDGGGGIIMEDNDNNILMGEESSVGGGGGATGGVTSVEDQLGLLQQQLSCLRTNDKDVLVAQLEKIIGPSLNSYAAHFFLDMNNWNVQLAVGSYFDLIGGGGGATQQQQQSIPQQQSPLQPPPPSLASQLSLTPPPPLLLRGTTSSYRMRVKGSVPESEDRSAGPSVVCLQFGTGGVRQELRVMLENNGDVPWPTGTHLRFVSGNANVNKPMSQNNNNNNNVFCDAAAAPVDAVLLSSPPGHLVKPGEEVEVTLVLDIPRIRRSSSGPPPPAAAPPAAAGHLMYEIQMIWRMCTSEGLLFATPDEMIAASATAPGAPSAAAAAGTPPVMFRLFVETVNDPDAGDESLSGRMRLLST